VAETVGDEQQAARPVAFRSYGWAFEGDDQGRGLDVIGAARCGRSRRGSVSRPGSESNYLAEVSRRGHRPASVRSPGELWTIRTHGFRHVIRQRARPSRAGIVGSRLTWTPITLRTVAGQLTSGITVERDSEGQHNLLSTAR